MVIRHFPWLVKNFLGDIKYVRLSASSVCECYIFCHSSVSELTCKVLAESSINYAKSVVC